MSTTPFPSAPSPSHPPASAGIPAAPEPPPQPGPPQRAAKWRRGPAAGAVGGGHAAGVAAVPTRQAVPPVPAEERARERLQAAGAIAAIAVAVLGIPAILALVLGPPIRGNNGAGGVVRAILALLFWAASPVSLRSGARRFAAAASPRESPSAAPPRRLPAVSSSPHCCSRAPQLSWFR